MKSILKYLIIFPILLISFSCDETVTDSTVHNGDIVGSWMLTDLEGTYTYTVDLPDDTWGADTSFGIQSRWDMADEFFTGALAPYSGSGNLWLSEVKQGSILPGFEEPAIYNIDSLQQDTIGLIGVFEDAPSAGAYATYKMKGVYPSVGYNYSTCINGGAGTSLDKPDMGDQGVYTWDQTSTTENFVIKRDPSIGGAQVLPAFDDGTLTMVNDTTINIQFLDRDAHDSLYADIPNQAWDEGAHPSGNGKDSGGDRSYYAFPPVLAVGSLGYGDTFIGSYDPESTTHNTPGVGPAYVYNPALEFWSNYMTWYAFNFTAEVGVKLDPTKTDSFIGDVDGNGTVETADLVAYMVGTIQAGAGSTTTTPFGVPYANIIDADSLALYATTSGVGGKGNGLLKNDSDHDLGTDGTLGGRMKYTIIHTDCAVPANVTIDFDATFTRCATDNCVGDGYHVEPDWD
jgi:hypothetical protein